MSAVSRLWRGTPGFCWVVMLVPPNATNPPELSAGYVRVRRSEGTQTIDLVGQAVSGQHEVTPSDIKS